MNDENEQEEKTKTFLIKPGKKEMKNLIFLC